ncbi:MAG TPA: thioredoxin domain-containing protein [Solirubrobacteraceae bacterium]|nr:thioredoxin domain-containing protein [Solirubrobacteraceae bacterium]
MTLTPPVDPARDHVRGTGAVDLVEYGDFQCPYCRDAVPALERVLARLDGRVRLVFRHFPVASKHPRAEELARAAEAAAAQGRFWEMHDLLYAAGGDPDPAELAAQLGLDAERFERDRAAAAARVAEDRASGEASGVTGTPAFFVAGERHRGFYDVESLVDALEDAGA